MKNRMLPFGYGMKDGRIVADRKEKEIVLWIFREYLNGKNEKDSRHTDRKKNYLFSRRISLEQEQNKTNA